jgi:DNA-binding winged helix-turn-helix (wHTH) protein/tetratricopeptide (TPR) repeat protein
MSQSAPALYEFGPFRLDVDRAELARDGRVLTLNPKAVELLSILIRHRGEVVERDRLFALLWPDVHVTGANLTQTVYLLRKTLGRKRNDQTYIETVPRRGYRFAAHVEERARGPLSLAVLPFKVISADANDYPLGLGTTDLLITKLSGLRQLSVRPTSAVFHYVNREYDPLAVGVELQVDAVLDGTVQRAGERVRLSLRLVSVGDGRTLWAEIFDEPFTDVFAVQDSVARRVGSFLTPDLNRDERRRLERRRTENFNAYQAYIRGLYFWGKRTKEGLEKSIRYFSEALAEEPDYALARAGLADAYALAGVFLYDFVEAEAAFENARAEAARAIELDETLPQAHAALFLVRHNHDMDRDGAQAEIARAVELNPQYATAHLRHAFFHRDYGDLESALAEVRFAQQLDPLSMMNNYLLGEILYFMGRTDEALAYSEKAHETDPEAELVRLQLAYLYSRKCRYDEAVRVLEAIPDEPAWRAMKWGELGFAFAAAGRKESTREVLRALGRVRPEPLSHCFTALIYAGLGETELAFDHLAAETARFIWLRPFYRFEPRLARLRTDSRFASLTHAR